jgi:RimJ/RimL family protein N-acetyltransferase
MLTGDHVILRARTEADVPILHGELYEDVVNRSRADSRAWMPQDSSHSPFGLPAPDSPRPDAAVFSVVTKADDQLAGAALLWGIQTHGRSAHIGLSLLPQSRGQGLGTDVVRVLCYYAFTVLGLHRVSIETLADNVAMRTAAEHAGFQLEGTLREAAWVMGEFLDEVTYGKLSTD